MATSQLNNDNLIFTLDGTIPAANIIATADQLTLEGNGFSTVTVSGVATPLADTEAANKFYVDNQLTTNISWKNRTVAATTANINTNTDLENGDSLDGVFLSTGDRVLVKDQVTQTENGIYIVSAAGAASRATDYDTGLDASGTAIVVNQGATLENTIWVCSSVAGSAVVGTDNLTFTDISGGTSPVISVNGQTGVVVLTKNDIGLGNVDNTSDMQKPVSINQQIALNQKQTNVIIPQITSAASAPTTTPAGSGINYTATADFDYCQFFVEDDDNTGIIALGNGPVLSGGGAATGGTYNLVIRAANAFGVGDPFTVSWQVLDPTSFTVATAFGNLSELAIQTSGTSTVPPASTTFPFWALASTIGSTEDNVYCVVDVQAILNNDSAEIIVWATSSGMIAVNNVSTNENLIYGTGFFFTNRTINQSVVNAAWITDPADDPGYNAQLIRNAITYSMPGLLQQFLTPVAIDAKYYLRFTPGDTIFDSLGTESNGLWMYGFTLRDYWSQFGGAVQLLSPQTNGNGAYLMCLGSYSSADYLSNTSWVNIGNFSAGYFTSTTGVTLNPTNGKIGLPNQMVGIPKPLGTDTDFTITLFQSADHRTIKSSSIDRLNPFPAYTSENMFKLCIVFLLSSFVLLRVDPNLSSVKHKYDFQIGKDGQGEGTFQQIFDKYYRELNTNGIIMTAVEWS